MKRRAFISKSIIASAGVALSAPLMAGTTSVTENLTSAQRAMLAHFRATIGQTEAPEHIIHGLTKVKKIMPAAVGNLSFETQCGQAFTLRQIKGRTVIKSLH